MVILVSLCFEFSLVPLECGLELIEHAHVSAGERKRETLLPKLTVPFDTLFLNEPVIGKPFLFLSGQLSVVYSRASLQNEKNDFGPCKV